MNEEPTDEEVTAALKVLRYLCERPGLCDTGPPSYAHLRAQAGRLLRLLRQREKDERRQRDLELMDSCGLRGSPPEREAAPAPLSDALTLSQPRRCYVCRALHVKPHGFYDRMCLSCGDFNFTRREQTADLTGRVALLTGARVKIGYHVGLKLLRAGARLLATTRFPVDAARRYAQEPDFDAWKDRLQLFALDLRNLTGLERFTASLCESLPCLDVLVNNAAQTIRRPKAFYEHLLEAERQGVEALSSGTRSLLAGPALALDGALQPADAAHFPPGVYDADGQQVDLRPQNSWMLRLGEVSALELLETQAVNALAPYLLISRLESLLLASPRSDRYIVNVSAAEGQLNATYKTGKHPHTNMAKAGLNMITRTSAEDFARRGVYMNSVDTGWVTNEAAQPAAQRMYEEGFRPPLDSIDGAARVLDPVFQGVSTGQPLFGKFLKNYQETPW